MTPHATLKDQLKARIADSVALARVNPEMFEGGDWYQLSDAEEAVFDIRRADWPRLFDVYDCYEVFKRTKASPEWDAALIEEGRQQFPDWCDTPPTSAEFAAFAKAFSDMTRREAETLFLKHQTWAVRNRPRYSRDDEEEKEATYTKEEFFALYPQFRDEPRFWGRISSTAWRHSPLFGWWHMSHPPRGHKPQSMRSKVESVLEVKAKANFPIRSD